MDRPAHPTPPAFHSRLIALWKTRALPMGQWGFQPFLGADPLILVWEQTEQAPSRVSRPVSSLRRRAHPETLSPLYYLHCEAGRQRIDCSSILVLAAPKSDYWESSNRSRLPNAAATSNLSGAVVRRGTPAGMSFRQNFDASDEKGGAE